ncbi:MAG: 30S ribosomal protein S30e [Candidatus Thorarchaeota archaeon]
MIKVPGSHGSLTKAGKVRQQTPKLESKGVNSRKKQFLGKDLKNYMSKGLLKNVTEVNQIQLEQKELSIVIKMVLKN